LTHDAAAIEAQRGLSSLVIPNASSYETGAAAAPPHSWKFGHALPWPATARLAALPSRHEPPAAQPGRAPLAWCSRVRFAHSEKARIFLQSDRLN
jgi:hypothetical protein